MNERRFRAGAIGVLSIAFAVRLAHVWQIRAAPFFSVLMGDSRGYDEWAQRIASGDWLGRDVFYQAPLYPYFLGATYAIAGRHLLLVRILQAAIGSLSCLFVALAARRLFSARAGLIAGFVLAFYAPAIFFDGLIQKSVLDVFFVCLALWLIARVAPEAADGGRRAANHSRQRDRALHASLWSGLGLAVGALALTRENALVLAAVIAAWALLRYSWRAAAAFAAGVFVLLAPVAARNAYVGGGFYITTSQAGPNFYIGNNPRADGTYQSLRFGRGAPEFERQDATELAEYALGRSLTPAEVSSYWTGRAVEFITSQPGAWLALMVRKVRLLVNTTEAVDTESQATHAEWSLVLRVLGPIGNFGVLVPFALLGIAATWPSRSRLWIVYTLALAYAGSVVLFYVFARYRFPLVPFLVMFAAAALDRLPAMIRARAMPGGLVTASAIAVAVVAANWPMLSVDAMQAVTETNLGAALQGARRVDDAIQHYRRALALEPAYSPALNNLGSALRSSGRRDEAVAAYEHALQLEPDFAGAHYNLANLLLDEGRTAEATEHFERALRIEPASADVQNNLGIALAATGRLSDAIAAFRRAITLDSRSAKIYRNLGDALSTSGAQSEAIDALTQAAELAPDDAAIQYDLGGALLEAGQLDAAVARFRAALRVQPGFVEAHNNLGIALGSQGRLDDAIAEFQTALKLRPDFPDAQRNLAMALTARRQR